MRKLFAIFLLCCLLFLTAGYHLLYYVRLAEAKKEMKKQLLQSPSAAIVEFSFTEKQMASLEWEEAKEFRFGGEMYDVVRMTKQNGKTVIHCVSDKTETALLNAYLKTQKRSAENSSANTILKLITANYLPSSVAWLPSPEGEKQQTAAWFSLFLPDTERTLLTPPPQSC